MDQSRTIFANFGEVHTLQIELSGSGNGTVSSELAGISCGEECSEVYSNGTQVTLTATPETGSVFSSWSGGGCNDTGPCTVTMDQNHTVTATFDLEPPTLQVVRAGTGSGTVNSAPAGINCGTDCSEAYPFGTQVILRASPDPGEQFDGWSGDGCSGTTQPCTVTMDQARTVTATFSRSNPADLVPIPASSVGFCTRSPQGLIVRVQNQGLGDAAASTARITFSTTSGSSFREVPTPTIAAGGSIDLPPIAIPPGCFVSDCSFVITVDFNDDVIESNEQNNQVDDSCLG